MVGDCLFEKRDVRMGKDGLWRCCGGSSEGFGVDFEESGGVNVES